MMRTIEQLLVDAYRGTGDMEVTPMEEVWLKGTLPQRYWNICPNGDVMFCGRRLVVKYDRAE